MNAPPGRPKEGSLPLGGTARSAQGAPVSARGRSKALTPQRAARRPVQ